MATIERQKPHQRTYHISSMLDDIAEESWNDDIEESWNDDIVLAASLAAVTRLFCTSTVVSTVDALRLQLK